MELKNTNKNKLISKENVLGTCFSSLMPGGVQCYSLVVWHIEAINFNHFAHKLSSCCCCSLFHLSENRILNCFAFLVNYLLMLKEGSNVLTVRRHVLMKIYTLPLSLLPNHLTTKQSQKYQK